MKISAINEKKEDENKIELKNFSTFINQLKQDYQDIMKNSEHIENNILCQKFEDILIKLEKEPKVAVLVSGSEKRTITRLKYGCLKQLSRLSSDTLKCEFLFRAIEIDSQDVSLWFDLGVNSFNQGNLYLALHCFNTIITLNPHHSISVKYLVLICAILCDFEQCLNFIKHLLKVMKCYEMAAFLLSSLIHVCNSNFYINEINKIALSHRLKFNDPSWINNDDVNWFKENYKRYTSKVIFETVKSEDNAPLVNEETLNLSTFSTISTSLISLLKTSLSITDSPVIFVETRENGNKRKQSADNTPDAVLGSKRSERVFSNGSMDSLLSALEDITVKLGVLNDGQEYNFTDTTMSSTLYLNTSNDYFDSFVTSIKDALKEPSIFPKFIMIVLEKLVKVYPTDAWDLNICSLFAYIFLHTHGKFMTHQSLRDENFIEIPLRFVEIYLIIFKDLSYITPEVKEQYEYAFKVSLMKIKYFLVHSNCTDKCTSLIIRCLYIVSFSTPDKDQSITYLNVCEELLQQSINLFSRSVSLIYWNCSISIRDIRRLYSSYLADNTIESSVELAESFKHKEVLDMFRENFVQNVDVLLASKISTIVDYLKIVIKCFVSIDDCLEYIPEIILVLNLLVSLKCRNSSIDVLQDDSRLFIFLLERLIKMVKHASLRDVNKIFVVAQQYVTQLINSDMQEISIKFWHLLAKSVIHLCSLKDSQTHSRILLNFFDALHLYLFRKKSCCSGLAKPLLFDLILEMQNIMSSDISDISTELESRIDVSFSCLIGYPSHKKLYKCAPYLKEHQAVSDMAFSSSNIRYFLSAYEYYRPSYDISYILINEASRFPSKKPSINIDCFKFLSLIGNGLAEYVRNDDNVNILESSGLYGDCLAGLKPWPTYLRKLTRINQLPSLSHQFDFSLYHFLSEYCMKTTSCSSSTRWSLLALCTMPHNYLTWWGCAMYAVFIIEEECLNLKQTDEVQSISKKISSACFCYKQCLQLLHADDAQCALVIVDFSWLCYNIACLVDKGCKLEAKFNLKSLLKFSIASLEQLLKFSPEECSINFWVCHYCSYHILKKLSMLEKASEHIISGVKLFHNTFQFNKNSSLGILLLLFELCKMLLNESSSDRSSEYASLVTATISIVERYLTKQYESDVESSEEPTETSFASRPSLMNQDDFDDTAHENNNDQSPTDIKMSYLNDDAIFGANSYHQVALVGLFHCLSLSPYNCIYVVDIASYFYRLAENTSNEVKSSLYQLVVSFLIGDISTITKSTSPFLSKLFSVLSKKPQPNFTGIFSLNNRTNFFRKTWKCNSRLLDGLAIFQEAINQGVNILFNALKFLNNISGLIHLCASVCRERNNTYLFETDRANITTICVEEISTYLEQSFLKLSCNTPNQSEIEQILVNCHRFNRLPHKFIRPFKENISRISMELYKRTENYTQTQDQDAKTLQSALVKYMSALDNKLVGKRI